MAASEPSHTTPGGAVLPDDERERLAAIRRYDVLDTPKDGAFDRITALAARHFGVPIAIVSIVDSDRIWFKSHHGLKVCEIGRDPGLCASAILQDAPWVVEDAAIDPRALANPLVAGELGLRFYAGAPLTTHDGHNLGTLCLIDREPRQLSDEEAGTLRDMAAIVMDALELRLASRRVVHHEQHLRDQAERMARSLQESLLPPELPAIPGAEVAAVYVPASSAEVGGDFYDVFDIGSDRWALVIGDVSGKGAEAAAVTALARHTIRAGFLTTSSPGEVLAMLNRAMFLGLGGSEPRHFCTVLLVTLSPSTEGFSMKLASAGHPPGILLRAGGGTDEVTSSGGPPAGWHGDARFEAAEATLGRGDGLVLYTDGFSEARNAQELLGVAGITAGLAPHARQTASELVARLAEAMQAEDVELRDDAAALVITATSPT